MSQRKCPSRALACGAGFGLSMLLNAIAVLAQEQDPAAPAEQAPLQEVTVTGYRQSLHSAVEEKRKADKMVDVIKSEDIADFPDANLAESLQRLPGVSIDRDNGEGRTITVRGLGSDFTRVRLNGMETLSTAGPNESDASPNRGRGFDFNTFASELFSALQVQKTATADIDEGSLGATVDLTTGRPLDFNKRQIGFSAQDAYYENGGTHNPRVAALLADQWFEGKLGALISAAYNSRDELDNDYKRKAGQSDFAYRQSTFAGTSGANLIRGFAVPSATSLPASITNPAVRAAQSGSNAAAYSQINDLTLLPALSQLDQTDLSQERLGLTGTLQWRPFEKTLLTLDSVYSRFEQEQINYQIAPIGLNRNNTNLSYNTVTASTAASVKRAMYTNCAARAASATQDAIDCGAQMYGATPVFAGGFSLNPNNLEAYEYYNNPSSVGYVPDATGRGASYRDALIGRPSTRLVDAHVNGANQADYLVMNNVDMRSAADASFYTTQFKQNSLNLTQEITDHLRLDVLYGRSRSENDSQGMLAEFNRMDSPENFVYDERGGGSMPVMDFGFDTADPAAWSLVKGFSALRNYVRTVTNEYETASLSVTWTINDTWGIQVGAADRTFEFGTTEARRLTPDTLNPSLLELGKSVSDLSRVISYGQGLDVSAGTPRVFIAPDLNAFREAIGFDCNCVNKWGDWRVSYLATPQNNFGVVEDDRGYFTQVQFAHDVLGRPLRGNVGVRYARTGVEANGFTSGSRPILGENDYTDTLPSLNLAYEVVPNVLARFGAAKVMARPLLSNLAPSVTALSVPTTGSNTGGTITIGNPKLEPFRGRNYDLSVEWYFKPGSLLSAAYFTKKITSFPQTVVSSQPLSSFLDADVIAQILAQQTNPNAIAYINGDYAFDVRQFRTAPGGDIRGEEVSYQQDLTFLPGFWKNFGVQANYTHIHSVLDYIIDPGSVDGTRPQLVAPGPWTGASPDAFNVTLYYETKMWSARVSTAYRKGYVTTYPIASGSCDPGVCDSPLVNEFIGSDDTLNVDASASFSLNQSIELTVEGLNLTNQTNDRWVYANSPMIAQYQSTGRQYFAGVRLRF